MKKTRPVNSKMKVSTLDTKPCGNRYFSVINQTGEHIGNYIGKSDQAEKGVAFKVLDDIYLKLNDTEQEETRAIFINEYTDDTENRSLICMYFATRRKMDVPKRVEFIDPETGMKISTVYDLYTQVEKLDV